MHKEKFYLDGISCEDYGIVLQGPMEFSGRVPKVTTITIPGRNGDLHIYEGSYGNISGKVKCYILDEYGMDALYNAVGWLMEKEGYRRLETGEASDFFRLARVVGGPQDALRKGLLAPFDLEFDCDPRVFLKSGEISITVRNGENIINPGMPSTPLLVVTGSGSGWVTVNGSTIQFSSIPGSITIDCESQNAYTGIENKNSLITASEFPVMKNGYNLVAWSGGVTGVTITPRWWV